MDDFKEKVESTLRENNPGLKICPLEWREFEGSIVITKEGNEKLKELLLREEIEDNVDYPDDLNPGVTTYKRIPFFNGISKKVEQFFPTKEAAEEYTIRNLGDVRNLSESVEIDKLLMVWRKTPLTALDQLRGFYTEMELVILVNTQNKNGFIERFEAASV